MNARDYRIATLRMQLEEAHDELAKMTDLIHRITNELHQLEGVQPTDHIYLEPVYPKRTVLEWLRHIFTSKG